MPWVNSGQSYKTNHLKIQSESQNQQYFKLIEQQLKIIFDSYMKDGIFAFWKVWVKSKKIWKIKIIKNWRIHINIRI